MSIDIRTLVLVMGITHLIQLVVFCHQYLTNKSYHGVGWWLLWSASASLAFICMLLRSNPAMPAFIIFVQNFFLIGAVLCLYIGLLRFLGRREKRTIIYTLSAIASAAMLYFLYVDESTTARGFILFLALATVAFCSATELWQHKDSTIAASANYMVVVFLVHGVYFSIRVLRILTGHPSDTDFFAPTLQNITAFLDPIIVGLLWTFGCILLLNQRSQADLTEAKEELETLFDASVDSILLTRLSDGTIIRCNDGFLALSGYSREETIGSSTLQLKIWKDPTDRERITHELRNSGSCINMEVVFQRKNGRELACVMSARLIRLHNEAHIFSITHDISRRKQAEADRAALEIQNQQLQKSESLGRMAGAIAHHFNNKLQVVLGNLELAAKYAPEQPLLDEALKGAMHSAHEAADVSGLMLTYLGRTGSQREQLDLAELCRKGILLLRTTTAKTTDMILQTDFPAIRPTIHANANEIQQILSNLVTNAVEACKTSPASIRIAVKTVSASEIPLRHCYPLDWRPQEQPYACLEVTDGGCGITEQDFKQIFDPFFSTKLVGRGLGLPVVLGLVKAHEGAISVTSTPGHGSSFAVYFPVAAMTMAKSPEISAPPVSVKTNGSVLLVEDEEAVRDLAVKMLEHLGYTVLVAQDGVEALGIFQWHKEGILCVLSDLTMPRMNGWETLNALRKIRPDIPVILVSGYDQASVMAGEHPEKPQAFVSKPYSLKGLRSAIATALVRGKQPATSVN